LEQAVSLAEDPFFKKRFLFNRMRSNQQYLPDWLMKVAWSESPRDEYCRLLVQNIYEYLMMLLFKGSVEEVIRFVGDTQKALENYAPEISKRIGENFGKLFRA
jgi:hypothetical protein